jgi:cobalamin biosynthesis Mg chelatase CobN
MMISLIIGEDYPWLWNTSMVRHPRCMYWTTLIKRSDSITLEQYINRELTTRYFNPGWIQGMMNEGYSGARYMSKNS